VKRPLKQNSFVFESRGVRNFSNVMWGIVPCRRGMGQPWPLPADKYQIEYRPMFTNSFRLC